MSEKTKESRVPGFAWQRSVSTQGLSVCGTIQRTFPALLSALIIR